MNLLWSEFWSPTRYSLLFYNHGLLLPNVADDHHSFLTLLGAMELLLSKFTGLWVLRGSLILGAGL